MQEEKTKPGEALSRMARRTTDALGSPAVVIASVLLMVGWLAWGYVRHFDAFSQLVLSSFTSVVTYPLFFLLLNTQNKDSKAANLKLDEVIRALADADNRFRRLEAAPDSLLNELAQETRDQE